MPDFSSAELIKRLLEAGFELDRIKGSHHIFKHPWEKEPQFPIPKKTCLKEHSIQFSGRLV